MLHDVKDLIRAAQAAEIRGDKEQAIEFLRKAAVLYETAGNLPRAEQMLRHVRRLSGNHPASTPSRIPDGELKVEPLTEQAIKKPDDR